jgi:hypothetical protein
LKVAGLGEPKQEEKVVGGLFEKRARYLSLDGDVTQGTFCRVVLPRDTVFMKKREQGVAIALQALLEFDRDVGGIRCPHNMLLVETVDSGMKFVQVPAL